MGVLQRAERGRLFAIELKRPDGSLTPEQEAWGVNLTAAGARYAVVRSLDELADLMAQWGEVNRPMPNQIPPRPSSQQIPGTKPGPPKPVLISGADS